MPASLENFASAASFSERGTRSVPSARGPGAAPLVGGQGAKPPDFFRKIRPLERRRAYQKSNFKTLSMLLKVVEIMDFCEN